MKTSDILYEDNHLIVVIKSPNIPTQEDDSKDLDMLTIIKSYLKEKYHKPGNVYVGLIHRLDRPVGGVMVFAKTSKAASRLSEQLRNKTFTKQYMALVHGKLEASDTLINNILKDKNTFKSKIVDDDNGQKAILDYKTISYDIKKDISLLQINIHTGRHHQIRVQLAHINHPIVGDQKYGHDKVGIQINLWATSLSFNHPITNEIMTFENIPTWAKIYMKRSVEDEE